MGLSKSSLSKPVYDLEVGNEPPYKDAVGSQIHYISTSYMDSFLATSVLQVQAIGYDVNQALTGKTLENISVYRMPSGEAAYVSFRIKRKSNSCALVRASDRHRNTVISTIYRFGPGRHPKMRIMPPNTSVSVERAIKDDNVQGELINVKSKSIISHSQIFDTSFGKFEWRYGSKEELRTYNADSLLVMEWVDHVALTNGRKTKSRACIAQFIRNEMFRTPGSKKDSGGNGGRLMIDLHLWEDDKHSGTHDVEPFVVASCILMLKREADRFIDNNIAMVA